jgi:hypothetical protein
MAGRTLNRRELREQADHAESSPPAASEPTTTIAAPKKASKRKAAATTAKPRKPRKLKAPPRQRVRWVLFDGAMKPVAVFDFNQRAAADEKLASLLASKKGTHFLQLVKEPMPEAAVEVPAAG